MSRKVLAAMTLALFALCHPEVRAQNVVPLELSGQPLQYMTDGEIQGCGLRVMALRPVTGAVMENSEVSINVYANGGVLVKVVAYQPEAFGPGSNPQMRRVKVKSGWLKAPGKKATTPLRPPVVGEDKLSQLYVTELDGALDVLFAQRMGKTIQLAVQREGSPSYFIFSGKVTLEPAEAEQLKDCLDSLWPPETPPTK